MIGYAQLWAADPPAWGRAGAAWGGLVGRVDRWAEELTERVGRLHAGWSGGAAVAAGTRINGLRGELRSVAPALIEADQVLAEFACRLGVAKARLAAAVERADSAGVLIDRQGRVSADPAALRPTHQSGPAVVQVAGGITAALTLAGQADREAAARLAELVDAAGSGWTRPPPPGRPPADADPARVRAWWDGLTPAMRRWLVVHEPTLVGRLDGVPAAARDQANRLLVEDRRAELLAERNRVLTRLPRGPAELLDLRRVDLALAGLGALAERLTRDESPRAYLLGLETGGEGRTIVALGNPDRADNVLTYVPGMTSGLADATGELSRAARVRSRCAELAPDRETAALLWLDYDAPDFLHEALRSGPARDAGPTLHQFQEGLRATHEGPPARQTVLGHSYGSTVVGTAARDHGLAADALVFVGSPGVGVEHAGQLRVPPGQVWSSTAPDDVIRLTRPPEDLLRRATLTGTPLGVVTGLVDSSDGGLWFGRDPSHPGFGGRTFPSSRHGHTGYWEDGNPALDGMAGIVLGRG
ncbi:alpha/beta hydrolase [Micromonospora sp. NPDC000207]|uniref:alpha/beta hydrolase n=1 Tax=Micromonospora sp. NPDC000207 TaxID=3154246 RepID=UPI003316BBEB